MVGRVALDAHLGQLATMRGAPNHALLAMLESTRIGMKAENAFYAIWGQLTPIQGGPKHALIVLSERTGVHVVSRHALIALPER